MGSKGAFEIEGSFKLTGRGLVIYGDIVEGTVKQDNFISFDNGQQKMKLKIKGVDFVDNIKERTAKIGLTFYWDSKQAMELTQTIQLPKQTATITEQ